MFMSKEEKELVKKKREEERERERRDQFARHLRLAIEAALKEEICEPSRYNLLSPYLLRRSLRKLIRAEIKAMAEES